MSCMKAQTVKNQRYGQCKSFADKRMGQKQYAPDLSIGGGGGGGGAIKIIMLFSSV